MRVRTCESSVDEADEFNRVYQALILQNTRRKTPEAKKIIILSVSRVVSIKYFSISFLGTGVLDG